MMPKQASFYLFEEDFSKILPEVDSYLLMNASSLLSRILLDDTFCSQFLRHEVPSFEVEIFEDRLTT